MPKRTDISSILIIGAGPIVIGQACEFDYSGTQACPMTIGPAPMIRIEDMSVRLGIAARDLSTWRMTGSANWRPPRHALDTKKGRALARPLGFAPGGFRRAGAV